MLGIKNYHNSHRKNDDIEPFPQPFATWTVNGKNSNEYFVAIFNMMDSCVGYNSVWGLGLLVHEGCQALPPTSSPHSVITLPCLVPPVWKILDPPYCLCFEIG